MEDQTGTYELLPQKPFHKRHEFIAKIWGDNVSFDGFHVILQYPLGGTGEIHGEIIGTSESYDKIAELLNTRSDYHCMEGFLSTNKRIRIYSEKLDIRGVNSPQWGQAGSQTMCYVLSELHFDEIAIEYSRASSEEQRAVTFYLVGPKGIWNCRYHRTLSTDGTITAEIANKKFDLTGITNFEVEIAPCFIHHTNKEDHSQSVREVLSLNFSTDKSDSELSTEVFLNEVKQIVDDLCLLASFGMRRWCDWCRYVLSSKTFTSEFVRNVRKEATSDDHWHTYLIDDRQGRSFLKKSLSSYRLYHNQNKNIFMPLVNCVLANQEKYVETKFAILYFALEKIIIIFGGELRVGLKKLKRELKNKHSKSNESKPEVKNLLDSFKVPWKDLYPSGHGLSVGETRNKLFHSLEETESSELGKETWRLRAIVERLLLRLLDWDDLSKAPEEYTKRWLTEPSKENT